jgi:diacylglycerol kinase family enzyme
MPGVDAEVRRTEHLTKGSFNDIDGEQVEDGPVQAHVLPAAFKYFATATQSGVAV